MRRTLVLKKDTLTELTPRELTAVAGGAQSNDCIDPPSGPCFETYGILCLISRAMYPCLTEPSLNCG